MKAIIESTQDSEGKRILLLGRGPDEVSARINAYALLYPKEFVDPDLPPPKYLGGVAIETHADLDAVLDSRDRARITRAMFSLDVDANGRLYAPLHIPVAGTPRRPADGATEYTAAMFLRDVAPALTRDIAQQLSASGYQRSSDSAGQRDPFALRHCFAAVAGSVQELIDAGLPDCAVMGRIARFVMPADAPASAPDIRVQSVVRECVDRILACAHEHQTGVHAPRQQTMRFG